MVAGIPGSKFVFARFLGPHAKDSDHSFHDPTGEIKPGWNGFLSRFEKAGLIHKIDGHPDEEFLKKRLKEKFGIDNSNGIYLIPVLAKATKPSSTHWRSFFKVNGAEVFQFKGIGNNAKNFQDRKKTVTDEKGRLAALPVGDYRDAFGKLDEDAFGALGIALASNQIKTHYRILNGYNKYAKHDAFSHLNPPDAAPFAVPVAMFKPLERVAQLKDAPRKNKYTRIKTKDPQHVYGNDDVVLLTHSIIGPIRLEEIAHNLIPRKVADAHIKKLATYYEIPNFDIKSENHRVILARKMTQRVVLVLYGLRTAGFAMHQKSGKRLLNMFGSKDFNGAIFYDTDGLGEVKDDELSRKFDTKTLDELTWAISAALKLPQNHADGITRYARNLISQTNQKIARAKEQAKEH